MRERALVPPPIKTMFNEVKASLNFEWSLWFASIYKSAPKIQTFELLLNPSAVLANTLAEQSFTVAGLSVYDIVNVSPGQSISLVIAYARVSGVDTLTIAFYNPTAAPINLPEGTYRVAVTRV